MQVLVIGRRYRERDSGEHGAGPDAANTIVKTTMAIPDPNAFVLWSVLYAANFQNSIVVDYWHGPTAPPAGANIRGVFFKA